MPRLIIRGQDGRPDRVFECEASVCTIGRSAENSLQIDDLNSSRHHCELHESKDGVELIDKDSRNGTFVNGRRVTRKPLQPGDKIEIGTTVLYFERLPDEIGAKKGKETLDLSTGVFSSKPGASIGETAKIGSRDDVLAQLEGTRVDSEKRPTGESESVSADAQDRTGPISIGSNAGGSNAGMVGLAAADPVETVQRSNTPASGAYTSGRALETNASIEDGDARELATRVGELRRLLALNKTFNGELNVRRLLEKVMDTVIQVSGAERGFLILKESDPDAPTGAPSELRVKVSRNIDRESIKDARDKISGSIAREVIEKGQSVLSNDAAHDARWSGRESIYQLKLRSVLSVPL
jgi:pSer/pThr/pTyr-binding forkhead associated (FHA) protein